MAKTVVSEHRAKMILGEAEELYRDAQVAFEEKSNQIFEAAAFLRGKHYITQQRIGGRQRLVIDPRGEATEVINFCRPIVMAAASKTVQQIPIPRLAPTKDDQKSEARARFTEKAARACSYNGVIDLDDLTRCMVWAMATGGGFIKSFWDPSAGRPKHPSDVGMDTDDDPNREEVIEARQKKSEQALDPFGYPIQNTVYEGEIQNIFVPTTDALPAPYIKSKRDLRRPGAYLVHTQMMTVRDLANEWPRDYFGKPTGKRLLPREEDMRHTSSWQADDDTEFMRFTSADGNVMVEKRELWRMPDDEYKNGMLLVHSGPTILYVGPNPYYPARIPFIFFYGDNLVPTSLIPDGLLRDIISLNRTTNHVESKKLEIIRKAANPHLLVPFGAGIDKNEWGDIPGQVIHFAKGNQPTMMQGAPIDQSMMQHSNEQIDRAKFLTGFSDLGSGNVPSDISGRGIAFAAQNEAAARAIVTLQYQQSMIEVYQHSIYHMRQRYDEGRLIRTVGENGMPEAMQFKSEEFDWDNDFMPEVFNDAPTSHAARMSELIELKTSGFFADGPEPERMRKMAGGAYASRAEWDPFGDDRTNARREQLAVVEDPLAVIQVHSFDVHRIHLEEHNRFRKSPEYRNLPTWLQARFDRHCDNHALLEKFGEGPFVAGGEVENTRNSAEQQGMQPAAQPGQPSPPDGGAGGAPAPAPSIADFNQMSPSEQSSSDQS